MAEAKADTGLDRKWISEDGRSTWSRMYFMYMCVWIYIHIYTNAL